MQNIKLTLQYDGTRYLGWKRPEKDHNDRTVSYKIENVLEITIPLSLGMFVRSLLVESDDNYVVFCDTVASNDVMRFCKLTI